MKTAIIGSRSFSNEVILSRILDSKYNDCGLSAVVSGGAIGADQLAAAWALDHSLPTHIFLPNYSKLGKYAPLARNKTIVDAAQKVIAFWDGKSKGTKHAIDYAVKTDTEVEIYNYQGELVARHRPKTILI